MKYLAEIPGSDVLFFRCHKGWDLAGIPTQFGALLINGVVLANESSGLDRQARKANRSQRVHRDKVIDASRGLNRAAGVIAVEVAAEVVAAVGGLHEIRAAAGVLRANTEAVLKLLGDTSMRSVTSDKPLLLALANSVRLIVHTLDLASVAANPESAGYGKRRRSRVRNAVKRLSSLFAGQFIEMGKKLEVKGDSFGHALVYQSFDLLLMPLLHNALKYSDDGSTSTIEISERGRTCTITVKSFGPLIPERERARIFDRGYQGSHGRVRGQRGGSGLGLYIAAEIAKANDSTLDYEAGTVDPRSSFGFNKFSLGVPLI